MIWHREDFEELLERCKHGGEITDVERVRVRECLRSSRIDQDLYSAVRVFGYSYPPSSRYRDLLLKFLDPKTNSHTLTGVFAALRLGWNMQTIEPSQLRPYVSFSFYKLVPDPAIWAIGCIGRYFETEAATSAAQLLLDCFQEVDNSDSTDDERSDYEKLICEAAFELAHGWPPIIELSSDGIRRSSILPKLLLMASTS